MGNEVAADWVVEHPSTVDESLQRTLLNELKTYFFVGGMPESVDVYRKTRSLVAASQAQTEVIGTYREDFAKYAARADSTNLDTVLLAVARNVGEQIKYVRLDRGRSGPTNRRAFDLLCKARVIHKIAPHRRAAQILPHRRSRHSTREALQEIGDIIGRRGEYKPHAATLPAHPSGRAWLPDTHYPAGSWYSDATCRLSASSMGVVGTPT